MKKIAIDLDNTFWDLSSTWLKFYNEMFNDNVETKDILNYDISKYTKKCHKETLMFILNFSHFWSNVKPYPYSIEYLRKLNNEYKLYIATNTNSKALKTNKISHFLKLCPFIKDEQIIKINNKQLLNVDYMVDDYEKNLIGGSYNKILINQPYNEAFLNIDYNIKRCNNLKEVYELIKEEDN